MATVFCKWDVAPGNGDGSLANPRNVNDVLASGNPLALAGGDEVVLLTDGVSKYTPSATLYSWADGTSSAPSILRSGDAGTGEYTKQKCVIDFSAASGTGFYLNNTYLHAWGLEIRNTATDGIFFGGGASFNILFDSIIDSPGGRGIQAWLSAYNLAVIGTTIRNAADYGINTNEQTYGITVLWCHFEDCDGIWLTSGRFLGNTVINCIKSKGFSLKPRRDMIIAHNTFVETIPSNAAVDVSAIRIEGGNNWSQPIIVDNLFQGIKNIGTGVGRPIDGDAYSGYTVYAGLIAGNVGWDCDGYDFGQVVARVSEPIQVIDPQFVGGTPFVARPQVDLTPQAVVERIGNESAWFDPGAIPHGSAGIGGGGWRPRALRHGF